MSDVTDLRTHLLSAADSRLRRVVAAVDAMAQRGAADSLIAPLRPRLARLRPSRPITFTRLLFAPVEPLIVPGEAWRADSPAIPRPALAVLGYDLHAAFGAEAKALEARFPEARMDEAAAVAECGSDLWPRAAAVLAVRGLPPGWREATGLPDAAHPALAGPLAVLLTQGSALHRLPAMPAPAAFGEAERLLRLSAPAGRPALAMMLALLVRRVPHGQRLLPVADALDQFGPGATASERVLEYLLGDVRDALAPRVPLPCAAESARRTACLLEDLQAAADAAQRPVRLLQMREARQALGVQCRDRMMAGAEALAAPQRGPADAGDLVAMEETARALRRLEAVGRRLGDAEVYDRTLANAAGRLITDPLLPCTTRLRLAEILLGPEAALALAGGG